MYSIALPEAIPNFSNPDVKFRGQKTGILNKRHNSLKLVQEACTVGGFFNTNNPNLSAVANFVSGGSTTNCFDTYVVLALSITGGAPGPINIVWEKSYDGVNYTFHDIFSTTSVYLPKQSQPYNTFMRATITDSAGNTFTAFISFWAGINNCGNISGSSPNNKISNPTPNPSQGSFEVSFEVLTESEVTVTLVDNLGNMVYNYNNGKLGTGKYIVPVDVSNFANGFYVCNIRIGNELIAKKIIVQK